MHAIWGTGCIRFDLTTLCTRKEELLTINKRSCRLAAKRAMYSLPPTHHIIISADPSVF